MDFNKYKGNCPVLVERFKVDAMRELGLTGHDKAEWIWSMAWKNGHEGGLEEVFFQMQDLANIFVENEDGPNRMLN